MSKNSKIIIGIVAVIVIVLVVWFANRSLVGNGNQNPVTPTNSNTVTLPTSTTSSSTIVTTAITDNSDAAINTDLSAVDAQLKNLDSDNNNL